MEHFFNTVYIIMYINIVSRDRFIMKLLVFSLSLYPAHKL